MAPVVTWSASFRAASLVAMSITATKPSVKQLILPSLGKQVKNSPFAASGEAGQKLTICCFCGTWFSHITSSTINAQ
jgi:hypothetical protein